MYFFAAPFVFLKKKKKKKLSKIEDADGPIFSYRHKLIHRLMYPNTHLHHNDTSHQP